MVRKPQDTDIGLLVLREAPVEAKNPIDIVAIHGLGAHPDDTWEKRVSTGENGEYRYVNWLTEEQMLPSVATDARIMRYGYESAWFGKEIMRQSVSTIATRLLDALVRKRKKCQSRPLIFIAHCFGGLVVLKALLQARMDDVTWPGIVKSTTGFLSFGTPFRGAGGLSATEMLAAASTEHSKDEIELNLVTFIQPGDDFLGDIVHEFCKLRSTLRAPEVACFYELKSSNAGAIVGGKERIRFIVSESAGCLDNTETTHKYSLSRNHFNMNKFGSPNEEDFERVSDVIERMVEKSQEITSESLKSAAEDDSYMKCKSSLMALTIKPTDSEKPALSFTTCEWIFANEIYLGWHNVDRANGSNSRLLTLRGNPATGKSALIREMIKRSPVELVTLHHTFVRTKSATSDEDGRIRHKCYVSVLQQLMEKIPKRAWKFLKRWERNPNGSEVPLSWSVTELQDAICEFICASKKQGISGFRIFLDGVDACQDEVSEHDQPLPILQFMSRLLKEALEAGVQLGICLSRRHSPVFGDDEPDSDTIIVEDHITDAIEKHIESEILLVKDIGLKPLLFAKALSYGFRDFLTPTLLMSKIRKHASSYSHNEVLRLADEEFSKLINGNAELFGGSYEQVLGIRKISKDIKVLRLLQMAASMRQDMTTCEFKQAICFFDKTRFTSLEQWEGSNENWQSDQTFEQYLRQASDGLITIYQDSRGRRLVRFTHLLVPGLVCSETVALSAGSDKWREHCHFVMLELCLNALDSFHGENDTFPFLDYAYENWVYHARECGDMIDKLEKLPRFLTKCTLSRTKTFVKRQIQRFLTREIEDTSFTVSRESTLTTLLGEEDDLIVLLASFGCTKLLARHLKDCVPCTKCKFQLSEEAFRKALYNAIAVGWEDTAVLLLERYNGDDLDLPHHGQTMLYKACYGEREKIVQLLLAKGASLSTRSATKYEYPLHVAIELGFDRLVRVLLDKYSQEDFFIQRKRDGHNVFHSVLLARQHREKKLEMLRMLLEKAPKDRGLLDIKDKSGKSAMDIIQDMTDTNAAEGEEFEEEVEDFLDECT